MENHDKAAFTRVIILNHFLLSVTINLIALLSFFATTFIVEFPPLARTLLSFEFQM